MTFKSFYKLFLEEEKKKKITVKGVTPNFNISPEDTIKSYSKLSSEELTQLKSGDYVPYDLWPIFRRFLVQRSLASNSELNSEMTAYTPGETLYLLQEPEIASWREEMKSFRVPDQYKQIVFVPCAKTKPWENATRGIYKDYNKLRSERPDLFFVTISEPLGIVPQTYWKNFPQYDNPGLFRDTVQRSGGLFTSDFKKYFNSDKQYKIPFDENAYNTAIDILAETIKGFLENNQDKDKISFVEDFKGVGTHSDMLTRAGFIGKRMQKRESPRTGPYDYLNKNIIK